MLPPDWCWKKIFPNADESQCDVCILDVTYLHYSRHILTHIRQCVLVHII